MESYVRFGVHRAVLLPRDIVSCRYFPDIVKDHSALIFSVMKLKSSLFRLLDPEKEFSVVV
jgi:hypothetical protein